MSQRRLFWISTTAAAVALLLALVELPRSPLPWFDEVLLVSAARSAASGHPAVPSVLNSFPHTMRSDLFYGPVPFWLGAATLKIFGLSLWSWRILGWLSGVVMVLESAWLVLRLGGSRGYTAMAALLVTLSPAMGSTMTSGRTDTITLALELFAVCLLLPKSSLVKSVLAGFVFAAAILSTPRAHPFALSFFLVLLCYAIIRKQGLLLRNASFAGAAALLGVTAWTFCAGLNPVSWYLMLLRASEGDKTNVSPLLGGSWGHPGFDLNSMILILGLGAWFIAWSIRRREKQPVGLAGVLLTALLANAALFLVVTSRALSYRIFWLVPLVPVVVAITSIYEVGRDSQRSGMAYVLVATILVAGVARIGKVTEVITSWTARDPLPLKTYVCTQIPQNSTVFGPAEFYYYAVEECGSRYLFAGNWTARGLRSPLDAMDPVYRSGDFLLWPADQPLPRTAELREYHVCAIRLRRCRHARRLQDLSNASFRSPAAIPNLSFTR
jgi:4-amino-4-deoxy-L-arabinose transferase-like glycosyltransferase